MKKCLIVVDVQNDFVTGSLGSPAAQKIIPNVKKKIQQYLENGDKVIFTRDTHYEDYLNTPEGLALPVEHCLYKTSGWDIVNGLEFAGCEHVDKETFGYPYWNELGVLIDVDQVELIGLCTDICVISNAILLKTFYPDMNIIVDASCCAGVTPESHNAALLTMKSCQVNVINEEM